MYNNINTGNVVYKIKTWIIELRSLPNFPANFPLKDVVTGTKIIIRNNHFEFRDFTYLKLLDAAMGT